MGDEVVDAWARIEAALARVLTGTMNGDVFWFLDLDPAPGGTPGQVVRVDVKCSMWDVLAPSWRRRLLDHAGDVKAQGPYT